jgi:hypothetical protein
MARRLCTLALALSALAAPARGQSLRAFIKAVTNTTAPNPFAPAPPSPPPAISNSSTSPAPAAPPAQAQAPAPPRGDPLSALKLDTVNGSSWRSPAGTSFYGTEVCVCVCVCVWVGGVCVWHGGARA